ncbi:MAG TPA: hypothetical protein VGQ13_09115 [Nitrososphaera sp.]|jgi:hypothetical protein|nr:hypothetical protein [Nitrososphaera sp.]
MRQSSANRLLKRVTAVAIALALLTSTMLVVAMMPFRMTEAQVPATIVLDQPYYVPGETAVVTVEVPDFVDTGIEEEIDVVITSETDSIDGMTLHVFEGGDDVVDDGVFVALFDFNDGGDVPSTAPFLSVNVNDAITATYQDGEDSFIDATAEFVYPVPFFDALRYDNDDQAVMEFPHPPLDLLDDAEVDELPVSVTSDTDTDGFIVFLEETGVDTNVFLSNLISFTTTGSSDPSPEGPILLVSNGDQIHGSFQLSEGDFFSTLAFYGPEPTLTLDSDNYDVGDTATVTVTDLFANLDPDVFDAVNVQVGSDCDESGIDFDIAEVAVDSGNFTGTFDFTTFGSSSGTTLAVCNDGDDIQANYESELVGGLAFYTATINAESASGIEITDATPAYWGVGVGVSGTTTEFGENWSIEIDYGDGETIEIPADSGSWSIAPEDGHEYGATDVGETFDVIATLKFFDSIDSVEFIEAVSEPFTIEVLKRPTMIDPYFENEDIDPASLDFRSALELKKFSVGGTLIDGISGDELGGRDISYIGSGSGPLPDSVTQGVIFEHPDNGGIEVVDCSNSISGCSQDVSSAFGTDPDSESNMVVHLKASGKIIFPPNTLDVQIYLQDMGEATFDWRITEGNGAIQQNTAASAGAGALVIPILGIASGSTQIGGSIVPNGLVEMEILSVDPDGAGGGGPDPDASVGIAAMVTHDFTANQQYVLSFETQTAQVKDSPYEVHAGAFFSTGTAAAVSPAGAPDLDRTIQMVYDGTSDPLYESSTSPIGFIDNLPDTSGLSGAIATGGAATTILDDAGNDIVQYSCATGNDDDGDVVCDNWEGEGLSPGDSGIINVGGSSYILCGSLAPEECDGIDDGIINTNDIYVEVDAQTGYMFTDSIFTSIKNVFSQAPNGANGKPFKLHLVKDESTINAALFPTKIWKDTSSSWLNGLQTHTLNDGDGIVGNNALRKFTISGLDVFTTGAITSPGHKVNIVVKVVFAADPVSLSSLSVGSVVGKGSLISAETFAFGTVTGSGTTRNIPITITYQTSGLADSSATGDLGDIPITFNVAAGAATTAKITASTSISIGAGSQLIVSNDDFDGIKRAYFGTRGERNAALGSFGQERANLIAKAQVYHYGLIVRSSGNTKIVCGNSGHSELGGNDFLVALGARDTSVSSAIPINCFTGPNGSDNEQIGTFLHEMGHNFNWKHGGGDDDNCKPNYLSMMSYSRQIPISGFGNWKATFSREAMARLDERDSANGGLGLSEAAGIVLSTAEWAANTALEIVFGRSGVPIVYVADNIAATPPAISFDGDVAANENLIGFDINYLSGVPGCNTANNKLLAGYDDWANIDLNFKDGKPIDGLVYTIAGQNSDVNDGIVKKMIKAGNKGQFSGLLEPINKVYLNHLEGISLQKKKSTMPLKVSYLDSNNSPITNANLYVKLVKLNNGIPEDAIAESTNPLAGDSGNKMRLAGGQYIYNLATSNLQAPATYGVEIWLDGIGTGTKLDNDSDGYAGFFSLKS